MDVKAIASTQSALSMHTANSAQQRPMIDQDPSKEEFANLDQRTKDDIIKQNIQKLNEKMQMLQTSLKVEIDKDTGIQVVKIVDEETKEVIRQLPPETMLKIAKYIDEITGLLFEKKA